MKVGVVGYSGPIDVPPVSELKDICIELGRALAKEGHVIFTGGRDGVMELVSKGAREENGMVVGILPGEFSSPYVNPYVTIPVVTGLDFQMRSFVMLHSVEAVVSVGGEIGTAIEILGAYAYSKPIILLRGTGGWTDRIAKVLIDGKYLDNRRKVVVEQAWSVDEVLKILKRG